MLYIIFVVIFVLTEYMIKSYVEAKVLKGKKREVIGGRIIIQKLYNKGAFLSILAEKKKILKTISVVMLGLLILLFAMTLPKKGNRLYKLGLTLILGGAISNVSDRFLRGYVVDYFSFNSNKCKKLKDVVFNLADMAIFLGSAIILLSNLFSAVFERCADKASE